MEATVERAEPRNDPAPPGGKESATVPPDLTDSRISLFQDASLTSLNAYTMLLPDGEDADDRRALYVSSSSSGDTDELVRFFIGNSSETLSEYALSVWGASSSSFVSDTASLFRTTSAPAALESWNPESRVSTSRAVTATGLAVTGLVEALTAEEVVVPAEPRSALRLMVDQLRGLVRYACGCCMRRR